MSDEENDRGAAAAALTPAKLKQKRKTAASNFTRANKALVIAIENLATKEVISKQFDKFLEAWNNLEKCHMTYHEEADIGSDDNTENTYLDGPEGTMNETYRKFNVYNATLQQSVAADRQAVLDLEKARADEERERVNTNRIAVKKAEFATEVGTFGGLVKRLEGRAGSEVTATDRRKELEQLEREFAKLRSCKTEIVGLALGVGCENLEQDFTDKVQTPFETIQRSVLEHLKDEGRPVVHSGGGGNHSSMKKEVIKLPTFKGADKDNPYLKFPVWKSQWEKLIVNYDDEYKATLLYDHTDDVAKSKFVGVESKYGEAMKRLDDYFGNPVKVVQSCTKEVLSQSFIQLGDYKTLVEYSHTLENNYSRLLSMELDHDISNTGTMTIILKKFPRMIGEEFNKYLVALPVKDQAKPFPQLISWLVTQRTVWERMAAMDTGRKPGPGKKGDPADMASHYGGYEESSGGGRGTPFTCHACGEEGHMRRECPNKGRGGGGGKPEKKDRRPPTHKRFWCALHKGDKEKRCWSDSCQDLKKEEKSKRIRLLKENKDCEFCCGDHAKENCTKKERKCGGGKDNRGCGKDHTGHEMYCLDARLCFSVQIETHHSDVKKRNRTLLQIMKVAGLKRGTICSVFWDGGSTDGFVRNAYARQMGFKGRSLKLTVTTLAGDTKEMEGTLFTCYIRDTSGALYEFEAYGLDMITGPLGQIDMVKVKELFPQLSNKELARMERLDRVDVMIGLNHASWHPQRAEKAVGEEGDFWVYRGRFGCCLGGSHPLVGETTRRSDALFTVIDTFGVQAEVKEFGLHSLEFCEARLTASCHVEGAPREAVVVTTVVDQRIGQDGHVSLQSSTTGKGRQVGLRSPGPRVGPSCAGPLTGQDGHVSLLEGGPVRRQEGPRGPGASQTDEEVDLTDGEEDWSDEEEDLPGTSREAVVVTTGVDQRIGQDGRVSLQSSTSGEGRRVGLRSPGPGVGPSCAGPLTGQDGHVSLLEGGPVRRQEGLRSPGASRMDRGGEISCHKVKVEPLTENCFFEAEDLVVRVEPKCGGCKCSRCPVPGSRYKFQEQKQLDLIKKNLQYNAEKSRWETEYPWKVPRSALPKNDRAALQALMAVERSLMRVPGWDEVYIAQVRDMVDRGAAIIFTEEELAAWDGDYYYLPHLVAINPKKNTPARLCFDASRRQAGGPSLNDCVYKGPDRYMNNLVGVVLGFRWGKDGGIADIKKFHNSVFLLLRDIHMQRFLWRDLKLDEKPKVYAVVVNNMGVTCANCIASTALYTSAEMHEEEFPKASKDLRDQTYGDDVLIGGDSREELVKEAGEIEQILKHAGMAINKNGWTFSGDSGGAVELGNSGMEEGLAQEKNKGSTERVLGLLYFPKEDGFCFRVRLNLSVMVKGRFLGDDLTLEGLATNPPDILTRRMVLSQLAKIFDPLGLLTPVLLAGKLLLRRTWEGDNVPDWDEPLGPELRDDIIEFFKELFDLEQLVFSRSLQPRGATKGKPKLIVFSDGSKDAWGAVAYIRWEMIDGGFWTNLITSKGKIGPKKVLSIPRMELNGAVMNQRLAGFLEEETDMEFERVYHLVDASTILGYIHKESGRFKVYEGVRISEIQVGARYDEEGRLSDWAWVPGDQNPADWVTKSRRPEELGEGSFWQTGPRFLQWPEDQWPIKTSFKDEKLEGEVVDVVVHYVGVGVEFWGRLLLRYNSWTKLKRMAAWVLRAGNNAGEYVAFKKAEKEGASREERKVRPLGAKEVREGGIFWVKHVQGGLEMENKKGPFRKLAPVKDEMGVWRVGARLLNFVPFTEDHKMPILLPKDDRLTELVMVEAHEHGDRHPGQDGTLARFRSMGFWTTGGTNLSKKVTKDCKKCKLLSPKPMKQVMGRAPDKMLMNPVAWGHCQLDLLGPIWCRSDVNPRKKTKVWGMVVEDVNSGACHLDIVMGYSTDAVLAALRRFGSLRGWPMVISSDPGSQLESAAGGLSEPWWDLMGTKLEEFAGRKNFTWKLSPADSPWRQGKVERRIGVVKRILKAALGDTIVTPVELQTAMFEISATSNERPIGLGDPREDGTFRVLTPNNLLIGRSDIFPPDDGDLAEGLKYNCRYKVIQHVTRNFWDRWSQEVSPKLMEREKWHEEGEHVLAPGDVVLVLGKTKLKAKYRLSVVESVRVSRDGKVRSAIVRYTIPLKQPPNVCKKARSVTLERSVQDLALVEPGDVDAPRKVVEESDDSYRVRLETAEETAERVEEERLRKKSEVPQVRKKKLKERWVLS